MNTGTEMTCAFTLKDVEIEGINNAKKQMLRIQNIWIKFGLDLNIRMGRSRIVWNHVQNLLKDVYVEENTFYELYNERIKNYKIKIHSLCNVLEMAPRELAAARTWIEQEEMLSQELDNLTEIKRMRLKSYEEMKSVELKHCQILNLPEHQPPSNTEVPSENDFFELEQRVRVLKEEKERRQKNFDFARKELTSILEVTDASPESSLEEDIMSGNDTLNLTDETFRTLKEVINKSQKRKEELEVKKKSLIEKLTVFWQKLKVEDGKRVEFLSKHTDCRLSTFQSIEQEIEKCEAIESGKVGSYISHLRTELTQIWDKCYVSQPARDVFNYFSSTELSVAVLEAHESEVEKWKKHFSKVEHILTNIERRNSLWNTFEFFTNKANDPNRFRNGNRNMLQDWKERTKLQKDLATLENNIFQDIENMKSKDNTTFLYNGENFKAHVANQWAERNHKKDKKVEQHNKPASKSGIDSAIKTPLKRALSVSFQKTSPRKLLRSKTMYYSGENGKGCVSNQKAKINNQKENGRVGGHKKPFAQLRKDVTTATPLKRTVITNFAKTAPSKMFKSSMERSPFHTPTVSRSRVAPSTVAGMASKPSIRSAYSSKVPPNHQSKKYLER